MRFTQSLLLAFIALLPLGLLGRVGDEGSLPVFHSVLHFIGAGLVFLWGAGMIVRKQVPRMYAPTILLSVFVAIEILASVFGQDSHRSFQSLIRYYIPLVVFVILFVNIVRDYDVLYKIGWIIIVTLTLVGMVGIVQALGIVAIQGVTTIALGSGDTRYGSIAGSIDTTALYMNLGIALGVNYLMLSKNRRNKLFLWGCCIVMVVALAVTVSLTGFVILPIVIAISLFWRNPFRMRRAGLAFLVFLFGIVMMAALSPQLISTFGYRIDSKRQDYYERGLEALGSGRVGNWIGGWRLIQDYPWFGVGTDNVGTMLPYYLSEVIFARLDRRLIDEENVYKMEPHNTLIFWWAEAGVWALVAFMAAIALGWRRAFKAVFSAETRLTLQERLLGRSMLIACFTVGLFILTTDKPTDKYVWLMIAILIAVGRIYRRKSRAVLNRILTPVSPELPAKTDFAFVRSSAQ